MKTAIYLAPCLAVLWLPSAAGAEDFAGTERSRSQPAAELPAYLQCVPYARQLSGVAIYGDAHTWWGQAAGRYERGNTPRVGAVMAFQPHGNMRLGHVAAVSRIIDSRTVLLDHANWSPINGRRGQIERNVKAIDVSPNNDWSQVRVWYAPIKDLGKTAWPVHGFIYSSKSKPGALERIARDTGNTGQAIAKASQADTEQARAARPPEQPRSRKSTGFADAFATLAQPAPRAKVQPQPVRQARNVAVKADRKPAARDPLVDVLSRYD